MKMWSCGQKGDQVGLSFAGMWECLFPLRSFSNCRPHGVAPRGPIWITNVFHFSIVHRFWSVEEFCDPLKPGDNDFHPWDHHRGPPPYWPLYCCPVIAPMVLLPGSDWFNIAPQKTLWGQCLFSFRGSLPPCCLVLAQVWAYQRQSTSVMWPNHLDTHLACSSEGCYEYSRWCQGPVRGPIEEMRMTDNGGWGSERCCVCHMCDRFTICSKDG